MKAVIKSKKVSKTAKAEAKEIKTKNPELDLNAQDNNGTDAKNHIEFNTDSDDKVGSMLKAARLKKELQIADVAKQLCIRKVYLEAIEDSNYEEIPDFPYGPGFVRSYADFLGLNGARLVQVFKDETDAKNKSSKSYYVPEPQVEVVAPNRKYLLISLICIALIYLGWVMYSHSTLTGGHVAAVDEVATYSVDEQPAPLSVEDFTEAAPEPLAEEAAAIAEDLPVVDVTNTTQENPLITVSDESFIEETDAQQPAPEEAALVSPSNGVFLKIKQETWVAVQDSEKLYLSKVLKEGDTYTVPNGGRNIKLSVGRLGAVDVYINGKLVDVVTPNKKTNIDLNQFIGQ